MLLVSVRTDRAVGFEGMLKSSFGMDKNCVLRPDFPALLAANTKNTASFGSSGSKLVVKLSADVVAKVTSSFSSELSRTL